jgi:alpha-beta hydrolase superfamily lysophospholipase
MYQKLDHPAIANVLFHPRLDDPSLLNLSVPSLAIPVADDIRIGCRLHLTEVDEAPNIIFFHGNGETAGDYDDIGPQYVEHGMNFLVTDYRGYGASDGTPGAGFMMSDCLTVFEGLKSYLREKGKSGPLLVMGRSLGSACAIEIAYRHGDDIAGLIVESGFSDTMPLLEQLGLDLSDLQIDEGDGCCNVHKIMRITKPSLFLHAQFDQIIPLASAEILQSQSAAHSKEFQVVPGADHNTILAVAGFRYFVTIRRFVDKILRIRPRRYRR